MADKIPNPSAFPVLANCAHNSDWVTEEGMSLRDHFAGIAMQSILSHTHPDNCPRVTLNWQDYAPADYIDGTPPTDKRIAEAKERVNADAAYIANISYIIANAMLAERNRQA